MKRFLSLFLCYLSLLLSVSAQPEQREPGGTTSIRYNTGDFTFRWWSQTGATQYRIQIAAADAPFNATTGFSNPIFNENVGSFLYYTATLERGRNYAWAVKSNSSNNSNYSGRFYLHVRPREPVLSAPSDGAAINNNTPFQWTGFDNSTEYRIQISTSTNVNPNNENAFTTVTYEQNIGNRVSTTLSSLPVSLAPGTYYWHVKSANTGTSSMYSSTRSFIICNLSTPQASTTNATCGESNGRIVISASGGTGNYEYAVDGNWSSNNIFSNLAAGQYQVSVRERNYPSCERSTNVTISNTGSAPEITTHPEDATICTGRSAVLRVTATGTGLSYQWKKDGQNVGSSSSYTATAAGDYMCVVSSNSCGQVESDVATVTVNTRPAQPTITPPTGTIEVGQPVLFESDAASDATYAWTFQNGTPPTSTDANPSVQFTSAGSKTVSLTVSDNNNCGASPAATLNVTVVAACPDIVITTEPVGGDICEGRNKVLSVVATGGTLRYQWKKDDTNIPNAIQASYTATQAGDYTCEITNTCGATPVVSEVATIVVNNVPNRPVITPPTGTIPVGQSVSLESDAASDATYAWTFQNGTPPTSTDANPSVTFTSPGSKTVSLTVSDNNNCGASPAATLNVTVVAACPDIDITTQPIGEDICAGNHIDLSIVATNGTIYQWKKDGIDIPNATQRTYRATEEGSYTCLVKSSCDQVGIESDPAEVTVINVRAAFTANANGLTVSFTNTSQNGLTWLWRFGNNTISTQESPTVTYATAGNYTVNLTATNGTCTNNIVRSITVTNNAPNCTLTATARVITQTSCGASDGSAQVTAQGGTAPYTYAWSNGATTPSVSNLAAGNYTVTVSDANSCTATGSVTINASTAPTASFSKVIDGLTVRLTNTSNGTATATNWTFGNNTSSNQTNPSVTYTAAGTYTITLRITTTCGVIESSQSVIVTTNNNGGGTNNCQGSFVEHDIYTGTNNNVTFSKEGYLVHNGTHYLVYSNGSYNGNPAYGTHDAKVKLATSTDGITWVTQDILTTTIGSHSHVLAVDNNGKLHVAYVEGTVSGYYGLERGTLVYANNVNGTWIKHNTNLGTGNSYSYNWTTPRQLLFGNDSKLRMYYTTTGWWAYGGPLYMRVLENGTWSNQITIANTNDGGADSQNNIWSFSKKNNGLISVYLSSGWRCTGVGCNLSYYNNVKVFTEGANYVYTQTNTIPNVRWFHENSLGNQLSVAADGKTISVNGNIIFTLPNDEYINDNCWINEQGSQVILNTSVGSRLIDVNTRQSIITNTSKNIIPANGFNIGIDNSVNPRRLYAIRSSSNLSARFTNTVTGLSVAFTNNSVGATSSRWNFGNGQTSTERDPSVQFTSGGVYTVSLIVSNGTCSDSTSQEIRIENTNNSNTTVIYENAKVLGISNVVPYNNKATLIVGTETTPQPNGYPDNGTWAKKGNIINEDGAMPNGLIQNAPFQTFDTDIKVNPSNQALGIVYQFPTGTSYGFRLPYKEYLNGTIIRDESAFTNANWGYLPRLIYHADGSSQITSFGHAGYILKSFGRSSTGTWTSQDITGFGTHFSPQASVLHNNKLYLATRNNTSSPYPLVLFTKSNGVWANEQVASMIDNVCDMVMNGDEINVLFTEGRNLKIAKRNVNTTTWQYENVLVQDSIYHRASLLFDGTDSYICLQKGHVTNAQAIVLKKVNGGAWNPIFTKSDFIFDADFWSWGRRPSILKVGNRLLAVYSDNRKVYKTELDATPACNLQTQITPNRSNATICEGDSVVLRATRTNPTQTFIWSDGATTDSIVVHSAGTYSVTITEGNCTANASQVVTVNALPNITISGDTSFCHGSSTTITAQGANSFVWSTGGATPSVRINSAGIFSVQGTASNGCIVTKEFEIEEKALPSIQIVSSRENGQATLEANADDCNFAWSNGAQTPTITVPVGAVYYVTATNTITGCTNRDSISTAILYTLKSNDPICDDNPDNSDTLWFDLRMDKRRYSIDAFSFIGQFDTTMLRPIPNSIIRGTALPTSANINTVLRNDSISIFIDVAQGSIEGDSNTLVIRIPFVWRVPRTVNMQTALSWSVLEERIWSSTSDHDQTTVIVKGTNVAEILLKKPTGAAFIRPTGKESTVRPTTECTATPSVARGFNPNTGTYRIRTDSFSHGAELRSKPAAQVPTGIIDANDVYLLRQIQQGNMPLTQRNTLLGDVNGDGAVTLLDVTLLRRRAIGIITNFVPYGRLLDDWLYFDENGIRITNCFEIQRNADQCDTVKVPITVLHVGDLDSSSNNLRVLEAMRIEPHLVKTQPRLFLDSCNARRTGVSNEWKIPVRASDFVKSLDLHFSGFTIPVTTMRVEAAKARVESNAIGQNYYIVAYSDSLAGISPRDTLFFLYYRTNNINLAELGDIYTVLNTELVRTALASCNTQTNVQNYSIENNVNIFPNPTIGNLTIDIQNLSIPNTEILIFNSLGQILLRRNVEDVRTNLELQNFSNGVYFVKVTTKDANGMGSVVKKITVAK